MLDFDTKLSDHPASTPLWECQNNTPSPISSFHPDELALRLTKPDSNSMENPGIKPIGYIIEPIGYIIEPISYNL